MSDKKIPWITGYDLIKMAPTIIIVLSLALNLMLIYQNTKLAAAVKPCPPTDMQIEVLPKGTRL